MQPTERDDGLAITWFRRPTLFVTCGFLLLAAAGRIILKLIIGGAAAVFGRELAGLSQYAYTLAFHLLILALPPLAYAKNHPGVSMSMRLKAPGLFHVLFAVLTGSSAALACALLTGWWMALIRLAGGAVAETYVMPLKWPYLAGRLVLGGLLPALCKELFFHGAIMAGWERRGPERGLVLSALAFAALQASVVGFPAQAVMGFAFGAMVLWSGSVWTGVAAHAACGVTGILLTDCFGLDLSGAVMRLSAAGVGTGILIADTAACGALLALLLFLFRRQCIKLAGEPAEKPLPDLTPLDEKETVVFSAAVITSALCYLNDILVMCGVLRV